MCVCVCVCAQNAEPWPRISNLIQRALPNIRKKANRPVIQQKEFITMMSEETYKGDVSVLEGLGDQLQAALRLLSDYCEVSE